MDEFEFETAKKKILGSLSGAIPFSVKWELDIFKARKKPVEIFAAIAPQDLRINTLEGCFDCKKGDIIIVGVKGEVYSCKPDIFEMTYLILPDGKHAEEEEK